MNITSMLLSDAYKQVHDRQYSRGLTKLVSYWTPRKAMSKKYDRMVFFGLQAFIQDYLIDDFNKNFFDKSLEVVLKEYRNILNTSLGEGNYDIEKIIDLHNLGYLPLKIRALPEGTVVSMGIPCIEITNTHPKFAWLVQFIECLLQTELWSSCAYATVGKIYNEIATKYYDKTVENGNPFMAMCDFGMRGMSCLEDSIRTSASWLLSFNKTSTLPAVEYIREHYNADYDIGKCAISTEHSVMASNYAVDGDEITFVKRMLTELYPHASFSIVSDTYDYWNLVKNILPKCKKEIMEHDGKMLIRPDSGDIVEITIETIKFLWDEFGGTVNSKGYKVLDPHIGLIYGDGCTVNKVEEIYKKLEELGFAANNVAFGVGAFCFHALFEADNKFVVLTRDTWGIAMKATHGEIGDLKFPIYKDPKTDTTKLKKSHKGCCKVIRDDYDELICIDGYDEFLNDKDTELHTVFFDGMMSTFESFDVIRKRLRGQEL